MGLPQKLKASQAREEERRAQAERIEQRKLEKAVQAEKVSYCIISNNIIYRHYPISDKVIIFNSKRPQLQACFDGARITLQYFKRLRMCNSEA